MSIREKIWDYIETHREATRAEFFTQFGECRKGLSRAVKMGELIREGDTYRIGKRFVGKHQVWTLAEEDLIREHLHDGYDVLAELMPTRTRNAIKCKAEHMGLLKTRSRPLNVERAWNVTRLPVFTRGNLSPVVRACLPEAA